MQGEEKMAKTETEWRVYTKEFKAEAVALAEKREKPIGKVAVDLGLNGSVLRRWMQEAREAAGTGIRVFPGHGRPEGEELSRLRKEHKSLMEVSD
jgi:transposase